MKSKSALISLILVTCLSFSSCTSFYNGILNSFIAKPILGYKEPRFVPQKEVIFFAQKYNIDTTAIILMDDLYSMKHKHLNGNIKVYDSLGYKIEIQPGACVNPEIQYLVSNEESLGFRFAKLDTTKTIFNLLTGFKFYKAFELKDTFPEYNLVLVVPFATYIYGPTKANVRNALKIQAEAKPKKVKILYLNLDPINEIVPSDSLELYKKHLKHRRNNRATAEKR